MQSIPYLVDIILGFVLFEELRNYIVNPIPEETQTYSASNLMHYVSSKAKTSSQQR